MENKNLTKVSMNLSERTINNVEDLSKLIGEQNRTRVVASAVEVAKTILSQLNDGKKLILKDKDGNEQEITFIIG
jgi:hypothetical protein